MENQKQINEIGDIIFQKCHNVDFDDCGDCSVAIFRAGFKKVPDDAVILTKTEQEQLKLFCMGEWVDTNIVKKALGVDFKTGLKLFDFCRSANWNSSPLNGQCVSTKFKLKG